MEYTNSSLVDCEIKSPNNSGRRTHDIDRITPHCVVGQLSAEGIGSCFPQGKEASCNYGIGKDGRVPARKMINVLLLSNVLQMYRNRTQ